VATLTVAVPTVATLTVAVSTVATLVMRGAVTNRCIAVQAKNSMFLKTNKMNSFKYNKLPDDDTLVPKHVAAPDMICFVICFVVF
jgi:hypothetical protein